MAYLTKNMQSEATLAKLTHRAFPERKLENLYELTEGYFNIAYEVSFEDGTKSILKIAPDPKVTVMTYEQNIMEAEVCSMRLAALPPKKPGIVTVPAMNYIAVRGKGDPNDDNGEYKAGIGLLYGIAFTIKMSDKGSHKIDGYFQYVVPPLEGFWWQEEIDGIDYNHKEKFNFISVIRLPDFVTTEDFDWAVEEATRKKKTDFSKVEFFTYDEGECVQCMHIGSFGKPYPALLGDHRCNHL